MASDGALGNADVELSDPLQVIELLFIFPNARFPGRRIPHPDLGPWAGAPRMQVPGRLPASLTADIAKQCERKSERAFQIRHGRLQWRNQ